MKEPNEFWNCILQARQAVNSVLEKYREAKKIGSALDAELLLYAGEEFYSTLLELMAARELRYAFGVSGARVLPLSNKSRFAEPTHRADLWVTVLIFDYPKCARCWHKEEHIGNNVKYPDICNRCITNIEGPGEERHYL